MNEPTPIELKETKLYKNWGLTTEEYDYLCEEVLKRLPNYTKLGIFSVMWSEHCSYKNSKNVLKKFPSSGSNVITGAGEDAGAIDIGDGMAVVFKAESHNHPSAVEPFQGAATGVGGIIRDIFSMGAEPIALTDSLKFGLLKDKETKNLVSEVVSGIGWYGNSIGIPNIAGEISFENCYKKNPLVNAMCIGLIKKSNLTTSSAKGTGNLLLYVGSKTGRDGIHGATFASDEFDENNSTQKSAVQVGNPFMEKLLMDSCLDLVTNHPNWVKGMQDMGAAGLISSTAEMVSKTGCGITLNLDSIPQRESDMSAYEMLLSESQERMVLCIEKENSSKIIQHFKKSGLDAVIIGEITDNDTYKATFNGETFVDVPVSGIVDKAPRYIRSVVESKRVSSQPSSQYVPEISNLENTLVNILKQPNISDKSSFYKTYDSQVKSDTVVLPGGDAGVVRIKETSKAIAVTNDSNSRFVYLDPFIGGQILTLESVNNLISTGARPVGLTDCLNFGNPENPEIFYDFSKSVDGISNICTTYELPVVSGNVSLFNEFEEDAIYPSPMIGMVGLVEDTENITTIDFKNAGDLIYLIGETKDDFNGSEIQTLETGKIFGQLSNLDISKIQENQNSIVQLIEEKLLISCHDISEGGLFTALAECSFKNNFGFDIKTKLNSKQLFSETSSRFVVTVNPSDKLIVESFISETYELIGKVTDDSEFKIQTADERVNLNKDVAYRSWKEGISCQMK